MNKPEDYELKQSLLGAYAVERVAPIPGTSTATDVSIAYRPHPGGPMPAPRPMPWSKFLELTSPTEFGVLRDEYRREVEEYQAYLAQKGDREKVARLLLDAGELLDGLALHTYAQRCFIIRTHLLVSVKKAPRPKPAKCTNCEDAGAVSPTVSDYCEYSPVKPSPEFCDACSLHDTRRSRPL